MNDKYWTGDGGKYRFKEKLEAHQTSKREIKKIEIPHGMKIQAPILRKKGFSRHKSVMYNTFL